MFEILIFVAGLIIGSFLGVIVFVELINYSMSRPASVEHNAQTVRQLVQIAKEKVIRKRGR